MYEDFIRDYSETVYRILDYLDISSQSLTIEAPYYAKTANHNSEKWVQQFRKDLQKNWDRPMW